MIPMGCELEPQDCIQSVIEVDPPHLATSSHYIFSGGLKRNRAQTEDLVDCWNLPQLSRQGAFS